jgi:excisionase family DNA binding protein
MVQLEDELLTVAEAAKLLKVTRHTIYRWIAERRLPAVRYSRRVLRVKRSDVEGRSSARSTAVAEARSPYRVQPEVSEEEERQEIRRLLDRYRELRDRRRSPDEPPRGSREALLRHVGVISKEEGEELWRVIKEARDASVNDPDFSFDD